MKQILQSLRDGASNLADIPCPRIKVGHLLIRTRTSLVSVGTERMLMDFGKAGWLEKIRKQPDKVRAVVEKAKTDGIGPTLQSVRNKLDQPLPMGYCNLGVVIGIGDGITNFAVGDRVVSNGPHAEVVCVPKNLCARVPDEVSDESAAFTVAAAIALQGIRLAQPTLGESFAVTGLGLIGLLAVQLLRAQGCRVLGVDFDTNKLDLARSFGAETVALSQEQDPVSAAQAFSRGWGMDGVVITASTRSSEPVHQAALMCRKRGRIVLVGLAGLELSRDDFYEKELSFQVSCSYGPGRYDSSYEEDGHDYPVGFVRWTEQRNFEAALDLMRDGRLDPSRLISHRFDVADVESAYQVVQTGKALGILFRYSDESARPTDMLLERTITVSSAPLRGGSQAPASRPGVARLPLSRDGAPPVLGFIGAGNYSTQMLIPAMKEAGALLKTTASSGGVTGSYAARKFGFRQTTTDTESLLADREIDAVAIATRHDTHARFVMEALNAGKHVFVEKPLALNDQELEQIELGYRSVLEAGRRSILMVGFNRRFAPHIEKIKSLLAGVNEPKVFIMTVNAGNLPQDHWVHDREVGGGRIVGEGCHFIDLLRFLSGSAITAIDATMIGSAPGIAVRDDKMSLTMSFADGSMGSVHYLANGSKSISKERLEIFCAGRILQLDNFRFLRGYGWSGFHQMRLRSQDKGHKACAAAFIRAIRTGGSPPIPFDEISEVTRATFAAVESANLRDARVTGSPIPAPTHSRPETD